MNPKSVQGTRQGQQGNVQQVNQGQQPPGQGQNQQHPNQACACQSGLMFGICCGLQNTARPNEQQRNQLMPHLQQAEAMFKQGNKKAAADTCVQLISKVPGFVPALKMLADIKRDEGQLKAAVSLLKRVVAMMPNDGGATCELATHLHKLGEAGQAEYHARNAVRLSPKNPQAHNLLGMLLTDTGRNLAGEKHYRKAMELHPPVAKLYANVAVNLKNQGKLEEARELYEKSIETDPKNQQTYLGYAKLEEADKKFDKAWGLLERAITADKENNHTRIMSASLYVREKKYDDAITVMDEIRSTAGTGDEAPIWPGYFLERGSIYDKMQRYDEAFDCYKRANEMIVDQGRGTYHAERPQEMAARLKHFFQKHRLDLLPVANVRDDVAQPAFIVGFPRSGTTMVEQILTSHPEVCAGDELIFVGELVRLGKNLLNSPLDYPDYLADLWMGDNFEGLDLFRDFYLMKAGQLDFIESGAKWFSDKMPLNEMHMGLISMVFPKSPIIHLHRHPMDVVLSNYFNDLTHGFFQSYNLETSARHYVLMMDLVDHYLKEMNINYKSVKYEDIVDNQEDKTREILEFTGLEWDERCMNFHENERYARTASYAQVTEKLYSSSRYRYKHYRKHLDSIVPILEPIIERLGYQVDD